MSIPEIDLSVACWYQTGVFALMLRDLEASLPKASPDLRSDHIRIIRRAEYPLRRLLDYEWETVSVDLDLIAKRNRSRLMVFDMVITRTLRLLERSDSISATQVVLTLREVLTVWNSRIYDESVGLSQSFTHIGIGSLPIGVFSEALQHFPAAVSSDVLDEEFRDTLQSRDPLRILLQTWLFAFESPSHFLSRGEEAEVVLRSLSPMINVTRSAIECTSRLVDAISSLE